jgi:hypothetical protein
MGFCFETDVCLAFAPFSAAVAVATIVSKVMVWVVAIVATL